MRTYSGLAVGLLLYLGSIPDVLAHHYSNGTTCNGIHAYTNAPGGVDPHDDALLGIYQEVRFCNLSNTIALTVVYTGQNGIGKILILLPRVIYQVCPSSLPLITDKLFLVTTESSSTTYVNRNPPNTLVGFTFSYTGIQHDIARSDGYPDVYNQQHNAQTCLVHL